MSTPLDRFALTGGTVPGRAHVLAGRGNQDAIAWRQTPEVILAVVADGCSSGAHCEVGAQLVARMLAESLHRRVRAGAIPTGADLFTFPEGGGPAIPTEATRTAIAALLEETRREILDHLASLLAALGGVPAQTMTDLLLCTSLGLLVTPEIAATFMLGDGLIAVNGEVERFGPFADNAPPYLAYGLLAGPPESHPPALRLRISRMLPTDAVASILVGSDGVADLVAATQMPLPGTDEPLGPLAQFWTEQTYLANADAVRRRLARANRLVPGHPGLLPDDTSLVVLRRLPEPPLP